MSSDKSNEERAADSLEAIARSGGRIALALEELVKGVPTQHERIQAECLYALLINSGIEPSVITSGEWADKLNEYIEAAKRIAHLTSRDGK